MRDFPSCFGENGVQVGDACYSGPSMSKSCQNSSTSVYKCRVLDKSCLICIVWSKSLMGQCLSIEVDDASDKCICKVDVKPSLFSKRKGSKCLQLSCGKIEVFWDLCMAKFGSAPHPLERYYIGVVCKGVMVLLIGDLTKEAFKKTGAISAIPAPAPALLVSKREHILGKRVFGTNTQFYDNGKIHDLRIEYDDPSLVIRVDSKTVMVVKNLQWKFRGNSTILIDGLPVEVFWDVYNWLFGPRVGNAVFMFEAGFTLFLYAWKNE